MRISKRILAIALSVLMAISMMPFTAFATEYEAGSQITGTDLQTGDKISLDGTNVHGLFGGAVLKAGQFLEFSSYQACEDWNKANGTVTSSDINLSDSNFGIAEYYFKYVEDYDSGKCYVPIDENGNVLEYILVLEKTDDFEPITFGTYVAPVTYTVTWKNADGTTLETDTDVAEGTVPTYDGATPAKASDLENSYTFAGWSPEVAAVTGDVTYTAQYTATQLPVETVSYSFSQFNDWTQYASERDFRFSGDECLLWVKKADHVVGTFSSDDGYEFLGNFGSYDLVGPANVTVTENNGDYILTGKVLTVNKDDSTDERIYNLTISTEAPPAAPDPDPSIPTGTTRTVIWDCYNDTEYKIGTSSSSPTYTQDGVTATSSGIDLQPGMSKPGYSSLVSSGSKGVFTFSTESGMFTKIKLTGYEQWSGKLNSGWVVENGECVWTGKSDKVIIASSQAFSVDFNTIEFTYEEPAPSAYAGYVPAEADDATALAAKVVKFNGHDWYLIEDNSTSETEGTVTLLAADTSFGTSSFDATDLDNKYSTSMVKTYLDGMTETGGAFADVADAIETVTVTTDNDTDVTAKLYLLSKSEAGALPANVLMLGNFTNADYYGEAYWLRSPNPNDGMNAAYVDTTDGTIHNGSQVYRTFGVRPALKLDLSKVEFDSETNTFALPAPDYVSYKDAAYDTATNTVTYTDATCDDYTVVAADTTTFEDGKWYVVNSNVTVNGSITVNGAANLILADGYTLTVTQGVAVTDPNSLTIFGQENGTGTLTATSTSYGAAGIGGNDDENGPITINGGTVNATSGGAGAGIGGGDMGNGGPVVINGGTVTAIGGEDDGAGIGSGGNGSSCNVTINGGTVNATGRHTYDNTAGIGNSGWSSNGGNIAINGGTVNAACAAGSQGIGGSGCTISITGGTVDVNRGVTDASYGLFGSGFTMSGGEVYVNRSVYVNTTITGGTLIAEANPPFQSDVSIGTGLKVLAGANEESAVEVEPSAINMSSDVYWNSKWIKIYPAPPIKPDGFNLTVEDKVKMNLYINVDDYTDPATATVTVTYNDPEAQAPTPKTDTYSGEALAALKDADDGRYVIPVLAAPAQIRDDVTVTVTDRAEPITTNVATYCETIIAQSEDAELVALAKAILDYGKACNAEFNYNVDRFEEQAYYNTDDVSYILDEEAKLNSADANGKFAGYSYIAKAVPALRIYLNTTEAEVVANDLKATVNGTEVTPKVEEGTGRVCVDITGILAEDLDVIQTVEFNGGTLKLNALQYAKAKGGNTDFSRSMCEYWFYAHTYFK